MAVEQKYLPGKHTRAQWMRMDAASILKRFFFLERALILAQSGWIASIAPIEIKTGLPGMTWQDAMTAQALRERVFELRYPSRLMEIGDDSSLVALFNQAINAPHVSAFLAGLEQVYKPALLQAYENYIESTDEIADGPTLRFLNLAIQEKKQQITTMANWLGELISADKEEQAAADQWVSELKAQLAQIGGVTLEPLPATSKTIPAPQGARPFTLAQVPARDERFINLRYYWPDIIDPEFAYGDGIRLQLRSAVSHFNEVWAIETAGAILHAFADELGWEFIYDAARWTYDEARHTQMGLDRLTQWGFEFSEIPLGSYIYDSAKDQDPIYRLGMLFFFETKNIGKKNFRIKAFTEYDDDVSRHDMDYDWADETIHASYGSRWLGELLNARHEVAHTTSDHDHIRDKCAALVAAEVSSSTPEDRAEIRAIAEKIIAKAESSVI